jgi:hypothetical protein
VRDALAVTTTLDFVSGDFDSRASPEDGDADGEFDDAAEMGDDEMGNDVAWGAGAY